jgi:hypothetical protein
MSLRTKESLQRLFEASRLRNEKRKQEEQLKYKKASQSVKKALADKLSTDKEKSHQKAQKQQIKAFSRTLTIYNSRYIERFADENELYTTREQLEEAMPNCINWTLWDKLVEQTKKTIYYDKH